MSKVEVFALVHPWNDLESKTVVWKTQREEGV